ncbi:MAG: hypothetical protein ABL900_21250 [Burkholderiaceae bacterium]
MPLPQALTSVKFASGKFESPVLTPVKPRPALACLNAHAMEMKTVFVAMAASGAPQPETA